MTDHFSWKPTEWWYCVETSQSSDQWKLTSSNICSLFPVTLVRWSSTRLLVRVFWCHVTLSCWLLRLRIRLVCESWLCFWVKSILFYSPISQTTKNLNLDLVSPPEQSPHLVPVNRPQSRLRTVETKALVHEVPALMVERWSSPCLNPAFQMSRTRHVVGFSKWFSYFTVWLIWWIWTLW